MRDVVVAGAGPAGSIAALLLARHGARVLLLDRARFPRDKLCGDTVNPGTLQILQRLGLTDQLEAESLRIDGMIVTGEGGASVTGRYPEGRRGRAVARRVLDQWLLEEAVRAGVEFDEGRVVRAPLLSDGRGAERLRVAGVVVSACDGRSLKIPARVLIAADGRRSTLAFGLNLARHPVRPRRWAIGAYFEGVTGLSSFGEMHVRAGHYLGVAPLPGGLANACLVRPIDEARDVLQRPAEALLEALHADRGLHERFCGARMVTRAVVLGPLAVDTRSAGAPGMLLAGDAAGFIDPMTGDGLRFAVQGAELAARVALDALQHGTATAHLALAQQRKVAFAAKWHFNRVLRQIVASPASVRLAARAGEFAPGIIRRLIAVAGDATNGSWD